nr:hypothetical protein CFP56_50876 [Quercus suber]
MATRSRQQPNVRVACEACHGRKIRCKLSLEDGPCVNCVVGQRQCYYLPRARSGRPRASEAGARRQQAMNESTVDEMASPIAATATTTVAWSTSTKPPSITSRSAGNVAIPPSSSSPYNNSRSEWADPGFVPMESNHPTMTIQQSPNSLGIDPERFSNDFSEMSGLDLIMSPSFFGSQPKKTLDTVPVSVDDTPTSLEHLASTSSMEVDSTRVYGDPFVMSSSKLAALAPADGTTFQTLLDLVTKLQSYNATLSQCLERHKRGLVNPDISMNNSDLHTFLQAVDCTFTSVYAVFGPSGAAHHSKQPSTQADATSSLTEVGLLSLTAMLKIFQGFELLSEYRLAPESHHTADLFLLYVRCEFNIVQTKVVLAQIGGLLPSLRDIIQQAATRANHLEIYYSGAAQANRCDAV